MSYCYDCYDPESKKLSVEEMATNTLQETMHKRQRRPSISKSVDSGSAQGASPDGSPRGARTPSESAESCMSSALSDSGSSECGSWTSDTPSCIRRNSGSLRTRLVEARQNLELVEGEDGEEDYIVDHEVITNWGILVAKVVALSIPDIVSRMVWKTRARKRKHCAIRYVEKIVSEVVENTEKLIKEIILQPRDMLDHEWDADEYILHFLFGKTPSDTLLYLANMARKVVSGQPVVVDTPTPCRIFGDIHGQLRDMLLFFHAFGLPGDENAPYFVFNGDFVDRGRHQLEVIGILFALKICYPEKVYLIRGNHEERSMSEKFGFKAEVRRRLGQSSGTLVFKDIHNAFDQLPLACVVAERALVVHGGIGDGRWTMSTLMNIKRPLGPEQMAHPDHKLIWDILWSDPIEDDDNKAENIFGVHVSPRGEAGMLFGWNITKMFCARNGLSLIVRSHQSKEEGIGIDVMHENHLIRVFTARDYEGGRCANDGAVLLLTDGGGHAGNLKVRPQIVRSLSKVRKELGIEPSPFPTFNAPVKAKNTARRKSVDLVGLSSEAMANMFGEKKSSRSGMVDAEGRPIDGPKEEPKAIKPKRRTADDEGPRLKLDANGHIINAKPVDFNAPKVAKAAKAKKRLSELKT